MSDSALCLIKHRASFFCPITYKICDLQGEEIVGSFYEQELLIEKVIRKNKKQALVKWSGYDSSFNSWIPIEEINIL